MNKNIITNVSFEVEHAEGVIRAFQTQTHIYSVNFYLSVHEQNAMTT